MKAVRPDASPAEMDEHLCTAQGTKEAFTCQDEAARLLEWSGGFPRDANGRDTSKVICPIPSDDRSRVVVHDFVSAEARRKWFDHAGSDAITALLRSLADSREKSRL